MKLLFSPPSPFVRKVRVTALEKHIADEIEIVPALPWPEPTTIIPFNPLGKVPTLLLADGTALYDSCVICEYLDSVGKGPALLPTSLPERLRVLRRQALADGMLDAAVNIVLELRRPQQLQSQAMLERFQSSVRRCVRQLPAEIEDPGSCFDLGQIAIACAVGYVEFRLPELDFGLAAQSSLCDWWSITRKRPSLAAPEPTLV
jgi:glutathione S-transferase